MRPPALSTVAISALGIVLLVASLGSLGPFATLGHTAYTYEATPVDSEPTAETVLVDHPDVLLCGPDPERACALESDHLDGNSTIWDGTYGESHVGTTPYRVVVNVDSTPATAYRPVERTESGETTFDLETVTLIEAVEIIATEPRASPGGGDTLRDPIREAIGDGEVTTTQRLYDDARGTHLLVVDGTVYEIDFVRQSVSAFSPLEALLIRALAAGTGVVLIGLGGVWLQRDRSGDGV